MERDILLDLIEWKGDKRRKPLILTGVRQCGKTYILKEFGKRYFANTCYINFESSNKYGDIFEYDFDVHRILAELEILQKQKIIPGETLLIFDEIQECPKVITSLKYFCEDLPELHLAAAGSLLGVALKQENVSFPVGKVNRMQMYPMNFKEFLLATGNENYISLFESWDLERPIPTVYSQPLEHLLYTYYAVGGMPEAVAAYAESGDYREVIAIQDDILMDYADDFSKHAPVKEIEKIRLIWNSIPRQLAKENNKFMFSHVKEGKRAHELEAALQWLKNAGLVEQLELVQNPQIPIAMQADSTYFKVYMSDVGLLTRRLGLTVDNFLSGEDILGMYKGAIAENYVLNELIAQGKKPYFWRSDNSAELDFIYEDAGGVVPVEVKAATNTRAKSYRVFCKRFQPKHGIKASLKNLAVNDVEGTKTISIPLYLLWQVDGYH